MSLKKSFLRLYYKLPFFLIITIPVLTVIGFVDVGKADATVMGSQCGSYPDGTPCYYNDYYYGGHNYCNGDDVVNRLYVCRGGVCKAPADGPVEVHEDCGSQGKVCDGGSCKPPPVTCEYDGVRCGGYDTPNTAACGGQYQDRYRCTDGSFTYNSCNTTACQNACKTCTWCAPGQGNCPAPNSPTPTKKPSPTPTQTYSEGYYPPSYAEAYYPPSYAQGYYPPSYAQGYYPPSATRTPTPSRPPNATATPTPPNACGVTCTRDSDCQGSQYSSNNQCIKCVNNTCQEPPSCGEVCDPNNPNPCPQDCSICAPGAGGGSPICQAATPTPQATSTPSPSPTSTPTPTPDFNPEMCKCDGTDINWVVAGAPTTVTQWAKVEGTDVGKAILESVDFTIYQGDNTSGQIIMGPENVPGTLDSQTATLARYKAEWNFTMPTVFVPGDVYRIQGKLNCVPGPNAYAGPRLASVVQQSQAENTGFWASIINFLNNLFGGSTPPNTVQQGEIRVETDADPSRRDNLQLETFTPGNAFFKTCNWLLFKFDAPTQ